MSTQIALGGMIGGVAILAAQVLRVRALRSLSSEQHNQVMTYGAHAGAARMLLNTGLVTGSIVVLALLFGSEVPPPPIVVWSALVLGFGPALWGHVMYLRGLKTLGLPRNYVVAAQRFRLLNSAGVLAVLGMLVFSRA